MLGVLDANVPVLECDALFWREAGPFVVFDEITEPPMSIVNQGFDSFDLFCEIGVNGFCFVRSALNQEPRAGLSKGRPYG